MGHERIGYLPKSKKWRDIVDEIANFTANSDTIAQIANHTTKNLIERYNNIEVDNGVLASFKFLILLSQAPRHKNPSEFLAKQGIQLPTNFNLLGLSRAIREFINSSSESKEYSAFANHALIETVSQWTKQSQIQKSIQFDIDKNSFDEWRTAADGSGFCELSRMFFSNFTDNYLRYFLEREASAKINNLFDRDTFNKKLDEHVNEISKHAFETSKITQSFSAGWFNKNAKDEIPSIEKIQGFVSFCFKKLNSEITREKEFEK
ncbi:MAG: hypothetical protein IPH42_10960 [Bacteroidetes bacterium]|nr:hypothetical protein [Bacteroidota bacterium]